MERSERFGELLGEAIHSIKRYENGKKINVIQDELGYAIREEQGGSIIEYWRRGNPPPKISELEKLTKLLIQRGKLKREWVLEFLEVAQHSYPEEFCQKCFPDEVDAKKMWTALPIKGKVRKPFTQKKREDFAHPDPKLPSKTASPFPEPSNFYIEDTPKVEEFPDSVENEQSPNNGEVQQATPSIFSQIAPSSPKKRLLLFCLLLACILGISILSYKIFAPITFMVQLSDDTTDKDMAKNIRDGLYQALTDVGLSGIAWQTAQPNQNSIQADFLVTLSLENVGKRLEATVYITKQGGEFKLGRTVSQEIFPGMMTSIDCILDIQNSLVREILQVIDSYQWRQDSWLDLYEPSYLEGLTNSCDAFRHNIDGIQYAKDGQWVLAEVALKKAIELDPNYVDAYNNLGGVFRGQDRLEETITNYGKASDLQPDNPLYHFNLATVYTLVNKVDLAIERYERVFEIDPAHLKACNNLSVLYLKNELLDKAESTLKRCWAISEQPTASLHKNLGHLYLLKGEIDQALGELQEAITIVNQNEGVPRNILASSLHLMALAYHEIEQIEQLCTTLYEYAWVADADFDENANKAEQLYIEFNCEPQSTNEVNQE